MLHGKAGGLERALLPLRACWALLACCLHASSFGSSPCLRLTQPPALDRRDSDTLHTCRTRRRCACGSDGSQECEHRLCHIKVGTPPPFVSIGLEPSAAGRSPLPPPLLRAERAACLRPMGAPPLSLVACPSSGDACSGLDTTASCMHGLSALAAWHHRAGQRNRRSKQTAQPCSVYIGIPTWKGQTCACCQGMMGL